MQKLCVARYGTQDELAFTRRRVPSYEQRVESITYLHDSTCAFQTVTSAQLLENGNRVRQLCVPPHLGLAGAERLRKVRALENVRSRMTGLFDSRLVDRY